MALKMINFHTIKQWSQRNALFEPISEATPTVLPTIVQRSAAEPPSARVTLCLRRIWSPYQKYDEIALPSNYY